MQKRPTMRYFQHLVSLMTCLVACIMSLMPLPSSAQTAEETVVRFVSADATMEDNPKQQSYNITIFSPDGQWKMQLNYHAPSMFGTFTNDDFNLAGEGRYYNFVRNPKNDMVFYSFTDMNVSVSDEGTLYRVQANCLTTNRMRFIVEATIDAPQPESIRTDDLGYARVEENPFYETYAIYAENDNFTLSYGITGHELLGTFYRADMLMPELYDKAMGRNVTIVTATAVHTQEGDNTSMTIDLLGDDRVLYRLSMFNGPYDMQVEREVDVSIGGATLQDVTDMYGCFLFAGANDDYQLSIAIRPDAAESGKTVWTKDDLIMQYTRLYDVAGDKYVAIFDIGVTIEVADKTMRLKADITGMDGTLYHVTLLSEQDGYMPEPTKTVNIDFGHVRMLDFTHGIGTIGIGAFVPGQYQLRAYLNTTRLEGDFTTADFVMDLCDIMVINGSTYTFHDARYVNATMHPEGDRTLVTLDLYGVDDVLYHTTMYIDPLHCLEEECSYSIASADGVDMMAIREGDDKYGEYTLQYQQLSDTFDDDDNIVGDGYYFSFYFAHDAYGVAGDYGYSAGTLASDEYHGFYERGCEVRVAPVAGTLKIVPQQQVKIDLGFGYGNVTTYLYATSFQFVGQNGTIYYGEGDNYLLCIDTEGRTLNLDEATLQSIRTTLAEKGMSVRKVTKDGRILVVDDNAAYDLSGTRMKE